MRLTKFLKSKFQKKIYYVIEDADWSVDWDGKYITSNLNKLNLIKAKVVTDYQRIKKQIIHFGSPYMVLTEDGFGNFNKSNKTVVTWFHLGPGDKGIKYIPHLNKEIDLVHTPCQLTKRQLINYGLRKEKIVVVPLGVDLNLFTPSSAKEKKLIRKKLNFPLDKIIIGSFQKDGVGWGEGLEPKLEKGPDVFCDTVIKLSRNNPIHILLTGPARGYIKKRLSQVRIPFDHAYLKNYLDIADYYRALDLYLVASRAEGGPKAILESMASGIPVVSTKVGMAPEVIKNGQNGFLAEAEDINGLVNQVEKIITNGKIKKTLISGGLKTVKDYTWAKIANQYYQKIYSNLL